MFGVQRIGRYEVLNHLASGGMGQVYLARATGLGGFERQVVVKTLDLSITDDDDAFVTMFLDEARLVGALHHQYIAPVYEVGCDGEGCYFLIMEYVHGETAEAVMRVSAERSVRMPLAFSLTVVSCVASALDYAHTLCAADGTPLDIVHRDVSLSNVMCGHDGSVKLIDFGIAKAANRATKTQTGTLKGKIGYLAPEQILRARVDHRADIFALGIVLYELTTGERAFRDISDLMTLERITKGDIRRPSQIVPDYPPELERIVMKALETEPDRRFQDAGALGRELEVFARRLSTPLGHGAVIDVMGRLFSDVRGRRRIARGSNEVKNDPTVAALAAADDEYTPITEIVGEASTRTVTVDERFTRAEVSAGEPGRAQRPTTPAQPSRAQRPTIPEPVRALRAAAQAESLRAQRPTTPIVERRPRTEVPLEDRPTPFADPAAKLRARHALIPLEDRPTPMAEPSMSAALTASLPMTPAPLLARPTPGERPARIPTGPQLPIDLALSMDTDVEDAPTVIGGDRPDREDPTDVKASEVRAPVPTRVVMTSLASPPPPPRFYVREHNLTTAVVARMRRMQTEVSSPRTWLTLCGLFVLAVAVACIVALL